jgi:predicted MFS family arabinose efflux permease
MPAAVAAAASRRPALARRVLATAMFIGTLDRVVIPPMLLTIAADLNLPFKRVAFVASAYYLLYGVMQLLWGVLADRFGRVAVLRCTLAVGAVGGLASAASTGYWSLLAGRATAGAVLGAIAPTVIVYIGDTVPAEERQHAMADLLAIVALGTAAGITLGGLCASYLSWRVAFAVPAVAAAAAALLVGRLQEPTRPPSRGFGRQLLSVAADPWVILVCAFALVEGALVLGVVTYLVPALEASGFSAAVAGLAVAVYGLSDFGWTRLARRSLARLAPQGMIAAGAGLMATGLTIGAFSVSLVGVAILGGLLGGGFVFMHSTFQAWAVDLIPDARGTVLALFATSMFAGGSLATVIFGSLAADSRFSLIFAAAAIVSLLLGVVAAFARRRYAFART